MILIIPDSVNTRLSYDADTGDLFWKTPSKHHPYLKGVQAGTLVDGYLVINIEGIKYKAHRIIWFMIHGEQPNIIDHINGLKTDNRISNLRNVNYTANAQNHNKKINGSNLPCGVRILGSGRYQARLTVNKKVMYLGSFATPEQAESAYLKARNNLFGKYARVA